MTYSIGLLFLFFFYVESLDFFRWMIVVEICPDKILCIGGFPDANLYNQRVFQTGTLTKSRRQGYLNQYEHFP